MEEDIRRLIGEEMERMKNMPAETPSAGVAVETQTATAPVMQSTPAAVKEVDADEVINSAFNSALINKIGQSDELKEDLMSSAERVIKNKVGKIDSDAERESKKAYFNNKKDACECFGYTEETTEKWAVNAMNVWHNIMTAIWIVFGCITFAPITFVARKIKAIFKQTWLAVLLAVIIYLLVVLVPIIITYIPK